MLRLVDNDVAVHTASPSTYDNVITGYAHSLAALTWCESVCTRTIFSIKGNKTAFKFAVSP